jgi:hypothetical protein
MSLSESCESYSYGCDGGCGKKLCVLPPLVLHCHALDVFHPCCSPANLVTNKDPVTNPISAGYYKSDGKTPPRGGFTAEAACVTKPGWGVVNKTAVPCAVGTWSPGDTMDACTQCSYGLTTEANSTQSSAADCLIAPGYGWLRNSIAPCQPGECRILSKGCLSLLVPTVFPCAATIVCK